MDNLDHLAEWIEIPVADLERAQAFYEMIFGLKLHRMQITPELSMAVFPVKNGNPSGALCHHPGFYRPGQEGPIVYLNGNPDLARILKRVETGGGKVIVAKRQISEEHGYMALFVDTEGNRLGIRSMR